MPTLEKKKGFSLPTTTVLLFMIIVLVAILTYIIPAGSYDRYVDEVTKSLKEGLS